MVRVPFFTNRLPSLARLLSIRWVHSCIYVNTALMFLLPLLYSRNTWSLFSLSLLFLVVFRVSSPIILFLFFWLSYFAAAAAVAAAHVVDIEALWYCCARWSCTWSSLLHWALLAFLDLPPPHLFPFILHRWCRFSFFFLVSSEKPESFFVLFPHSIFSVLPFYSQNKTCHLLTRKETVLFCGKKDSDARLPRRTTWCTRFFVAQSLKIDTFSLHQRREDK